MSTVISCQFFDNDGAPLQGRNRMRVSVNTNATIADLAEGGLRRLVKWLRFAQDTTLTVVDVSAGNDDLLFPEDSVADVIRPGETVSLRLQENPQIRAVRPVLTMNVPADSATKVAPKHASPTAVQGARDVKKAAKLHTKELGPGVDNAKFFSENYCSDPDALVRELRKKRHAEPAAEKPEVSREASPKEPRQPTPPTEENSEIPSDRPEETTIADKALVLGFGTDGHKFFDSNYVSDPELLARRNRREKRERAKLTAALGSSSKDPITVDDSAAATAATAAPIVQSSGTAGSHKTQPKVTEPALCAKGVVHKSAPQVERCLFTGSGGETEEGPFALTPLANLQA